MDQWPKLRWAISSTLLRWHKIQKWSTVSFWNFPFNIVTVQLSLFLRPWMRGDCILVHIFAQTESHYTCLCSWLPACRQQLLSYYWGWAPCPGSCGCSPSCSYWSPRSRARALQQEQSPQWEACIPQWEARTPQLARSPHSLQLEKSPCSNNDPGQPKTNK